jgi:hypothetical protein
LKSRRKKRVGHVACMKGMRSAHTAVVVRTEAKRPLIKQRITYKDNIKINPQEI